MDHFQAAYDEQLMTTTATLQPTMPIHVYVSPFQPTYAFPLLLPEQRDVDMWRGRGTNIVTVVAVRHFTRPALRAAWFARARAFAAFSHHVISFSQTT